MVNFGINLKGKVDEDSNVRVVRINGMQKEVFDVKRSELDYKSVDDIVAERNTKKTIEAECEMEEQERF